MSDHILNSPYQTLEQVGIPITAPIVEGSGDLIPGLLPLQGEIVIAGETNVGKSLVALEIISSLITGEPLWGGLQPTKKATKVAYCLGEHYAEVLQKLARYTKLPFTDQVLILGPEQLSWDKWLVTQGRINIQSVNKFQTWFEGVDLVVWDPLAAFISGMDAENDNVQMRLVIQTMSDLAHKAGASCIILAHQGKPSLNRDGQEMSRKSYAIRGASAIEDAATNIFYMNRASGESKAAQNVPMDMKMYDLTCRKYKGETPNTYHLVRDSSTLCHTLLGDKPFIEVQKIATQSKIIKMQLACPEHNLSTIVKMVAALDGTSERTIWRHLGTEMP